MASDNEASCIADPNFAVICGFLQKFGTSCGLSSIDFIDLQKMIENTQEVPQPLLDLHLKLLRRIKKTVAIERWEKVLSKVCHTYNNQDGWEIERFGYKKARISCKLRTLKTLLEMQFDCHTKFKNELNKLSADELRSQPLGRDKLGHAYWCQIDADCQIRVYKEDPDEETWMLVARDREGLLSLISQLKENDSVITGIEPVLNEDSNSLEIEKPILDTGQVDSTPEHKPDEKPEDGDKQTDEIEITIENGKEEPEAKTEELPKPIGIRLKPMSELLNSPNAAQYKADEEAKKKRNNDEAVDNPKPAKSRKLTLMNSKPVKKRIEESSEDDDDDMDEDDEDMDDEDDSDEISEEIEEPVVYIKGRGRGKDNCTGNVQSSPIIGEEISEDILYVYGEGAGKDCQTGNENNDDKSSKEQTKKSTIKLGMVIDSRADKMGESAAKAPTKKNRWDVGKPTDNDDKEAGKPAAKVSMFFFGPNTNANAGISFFGASSSPAKDSDSNSKSAEDSQNPKDQESDNNIDNSKSNDENSVINHKTHFGEALEKKLDIPRTGNQVSDESSQETPIVPARTISEDLSKAVVENETGKEMEVATTNNENVFKDEDSKEINVLSTVENPISKVKDKEIPIDSTNIEKLLSKDLEGENKGTEEQKKESSENNLDHSLNMKEITMKSRLEGDKLMVEASSVVCDISKEETRLKPEETAVKSIELNSSTTNASSNTLDELSAKAFASSESDNLSKSDNVRTTKENMIYSNTMITEMEIEDAIEIADPNIGDRSGESMEIEALVTKTDQEKSGENMEIEEIQKGEAATKQKSLGELIQEAKLTHSCIDTSLAQKDKVILETSTSIESTEALSIDLSTTDDSKTTTMDIEESSDSITITINKTTECLSVSQDTDKVSKDTELPESILKELATTTTSSEMEIATENDKEQKLKYLETQSDEQIEDLSTKKRDMDKDVEPAKKMLSSVESCILQTSETTLTNIETPAIIVSTDASVVKEPECVKKAIAPLTNTEDSAAKKKALDKPSDVEKKAASPLQSIQSVESIDADCHASSIDRESEIDTAEDPLDNVGIPPDDPLGLAEQEQAAEDEIDEAEEEEIDEEEEEEEIDPEALDDEEADGGDDEGVDEEEMEDEELEGEEEEEEDEDGDEDDATTNPPTKGPKIITPTKDKKATLTSFSMDFNDSSDSLNLPPMLKEKLKKRQLMQKKELVKGKSADSDHSDQVDEEEDSNDEEVEEEEDEGGEEEDDEDDSDEAELPPPKVKGEELKQVQPLVKGAVPKLPLVAPPVQAEKTSTTADLRKERKKKKSEVEILREEIEVKSALVSGVRQSRRIAQIKIREEAEKRKLEDLTLAQVKFESRKMFENAEKIKKGKLSSDEEYIDLDDAKKKMKKKKKHKRSRFDEYNPWKSSSEEECEESAEEEQEEEMADDSDHYREPKSDHEFSPESDLEDGTEVKPLKRARTVRKEDKSEEDDQETDDTPCEKCGKFDHPEWILLCDGCDHGWHCSCLRPALLVIPEGDWFCPPCQHAKLLKQLELQLVDLDKRRSKQQIEVRRKERLAYVGISLNNVLATKDSDAKKDGNARSDSSSSGSSGSTDSSDSDEPIYQLRQRRQAHSYRFNDYDDLINSAIQDEDEPEVEEAVGNQGRGKDIATIVNAEKEHGGDKPAKKVVKRKKKRKLNSLVVSSGEDGTSDEDFRGSSTEYDEDDQEFDEPGSSNSSYDSCMGRKRKKGGGATRRSTRARWSRMDTDFINDDTDDDLPDEPKKRHKRSKWTDDSDDLDEEDDLSELSDRSWGKKRKSGGSTKRSSSKSNKTSKKKSRQIKRGSDSDEPVQKKKRKIKFGGLNDSDDADERKPSKVDSVRRTRGKKITYIDALGSDSEEEMRRRKAGIVEESEEEYVAEDDDGLEDEDGNEIEKDSDDSDSAAPTKVHIKPVAKKGKGKGGIKRIKRAQGIEDELFPPLKPEEISEEATPPTKPEVSLTTSATKEDKSKSNNEETKEEDVDKSSLSEVSVDPMQEINRNMESMDEKLMMEDPDYATKQLQMVAAQLERKKKEEAAAAAAAEAAATSEDMAKHRRGRKPKVIPYMSPAPQILQAKLQQHQKEDPQLENTNSNSPDAAVIPSFGELSGTPSEDGSPMKKRRGRGKGKKTLEKEAAAAAALAAAATALGKEDLGKPPEDVLPVIKPTPTSLDPASMATAKLAIATPPQPFSQTEPTPSVITRMLQAPQAGLPCPGTPPGSSSPASAGIVPYGPGPPPPHKYYGSGLGPPPLVGDVGRPPPPPLRGAPPPHLPPGMPPHGMGGPPYGPPMNHRPYHGGPPGPGIALPPHMLQRATPAASHSPPMPAGAMYHHHHTVDASPSGGSAIQPPGSPGRIPGVAPPPTSVPSHLAGVPPDRHTPPPPPIGGGGPRYPPHAPHQPSPRQHPHHMVPPQLGMLGLPPRPVPPSGYPPSPYYAAYPPQPSGIPPEDYHHHHHHQQHHHHQHHHPPPPPSHGYSEGPPPPQPPLAVVPPTTTTQPPPPPPPTAATTATTGPPQPPDPIPPAVSSEAAIVGGLKAPHHGGEVAVAPAQDSTGEFGGLVSYFSSQREDDLDG